MTTFGDLIAVADRHHATLTTALYRPSINEHAGHPGVVAELVRCANVLARYNRKIADGFGVPTMLDEGVRRVARQSDILISQAQTILGEPPSDEPYGPRLSWTLRATSQTLGCGLDLLASHFPVNPSDANKRLSGDAAVIAATDTARALLHKLSRYAATIGHLAMATGPERHEAGALLLKAALLEGLHSDDTPTPITAVALRLNHERIPPTPGESLDQALHGLSTSAERLRTADQPSSIATYRYLSMAAVVSSELTELLSRRLGRRLHELDHHEPAIQLTTSTAQALNSLRAKWRVIARCWKELPQQHGTPATVLAIDASDLVTRLGRLIYDDPAWKPGPRATQRVLPTSHVAPATEDVARIGLAAVKALEAWNATAEHHRVAVNDLAILKSLLTPPRTTARNASDSHHEIGIHVPTRPAEVRRLLDRYRNVHAQGSAVISGFGTTLLMLSSAGSAISTETDLIVRRAAARGVPTPVGQAAADFPIPISEALGPPPVPTAIQPRSATASAQAPSASLRTVRP